MNTLTGKQAESELLTEAREREGRLKASVDVRGKGNQSR